MILRFKRLSEPLFLVLSRFLGSLLASSERAKVRFFDRGSSKMTSRCSVQGCFEEAPKRGVHFSKAPKIRFGTILKRF